MLTNVIQIGGCLLRKELFQPTSEGEARILLLISGFTTSSSSLEGRTKLAKLDFLLRYPKYMVRILEIRMRQRDYSVPVSALMVRPEEVINIENQMVRYKFGPWDPSYFAILGRLVGKGLVIPVSAKRGVGYRVTSEGSKIAERLGATAEWSEDVKRIKLLKKHLNLTGNSLKNMIYEHIPEVSLAKWGAKL